jgi:hypothetical protein
VLSGCVGVDDCETSLDLGGGDLVAMLPGAATESSIPLWPKETELVFLPGANHPTLSAQLPHMRLVIQDAMENLRASIIFRHAFPDPRTTFSFVSEALLAAAAAHQPHSFYIQKRLVTDQDYLSKMIHLVSLSAFSLYSTKDACSCMPRSL